ncbi:hypothetical protein LCGC14_1715980 [marine sediment metagenome]|uniref:Uncharacterized protein n=1 Tax=marine sediment metagenome TaxID=412755 RepID=A0A0F9I1D7_9ZZZZ
MTTLERLRIAGELCMKWKRMMELMFERLGERLEK